MPPTNDTHSRIASGSVIVLADKPWPAAVRRRLRRVEPELAGRGVIPVFHERGIILGVQCQLVEGGALSLDRATLHQLEFLEFLRPGDDVFTGETGPTVRIDDPHRNQGPHTPASRIRVERDRERALQSRQRHSLDAVAPPMKQ